MWLILMANHYLVQTCPQFVIKFTGSSVFMRARRSAPAPTDGDGRKHGVLDWLICIICSSGAISQASTAIIIIHWLSGIYRLWYTTVKMSWRLICLREFGLMQYVFYLANITLAVSISYSCLLSYHCLFLW